MTTLPCSKCALLALELASATFEVTAIQKDILARSREKTSPTDAAMLRRAMGIAREAIDALAEHKLFHEMALAS
jgi:hypothetical protein